MRLANLVLVVSAVASTACGKGPSQPSESVDRDGTSARVALDVEVIRRILDEDQTRGPIADVDRALDEDRPVRAAELIEVTALPASRAAASRMRSVALRTDEGRALASRAVTALDARTDALSAYGRALARGPVEDAVLLDALRRYRHAERGLLDVYAALDRARGEGQPSGSTGEAP